MRIVSFPPATSLSACFWARLTTSVSWLVTLCWSASVWKCEKISFGSSKWRAFCVALLSQLVSSEVALSFKEVDGEEITCFVLRSTCRMIAYTAGGVWDYTHLPRSVHVKADQQIDIFSWAISSWYSVCKLQAYWTELENVKSLLCMSGKYQHEWKHLWCWCLGAAWPNACVYLHVHSHHLGVVFKVSHYAQ